MRKRKMAALICCLALSLTGCGFHGWDSWKWIAFADELAGQLGASQLTSDEDLFGERVCDTSAYEGSYTAQCRHSTGKDVVFGGGSLRSYRLRVYGRIQCDSGRAAVRIRMNEEVVILETDENGCFETELRFGSGGNYIMVEYEDFSGTVELTSARLPLDWDNYADIV